jgi:hypothetical protein
MVLAATVHANLTRCGRARRMLDVPDGMHVRVFSMGRVTHVPARTRATSKEQHDEGIKATIF